MLITDQHLVISLLAENPEIDFGHWIVGKNLQHLTGFHFGQTPAGPEHRLRAKQPFRVQCHFSSRLTGFHRCSHNNGMQGIIVNATTEI